MDLKTMLAKLKTSKKAQMGMGVVGVVIFIILLVSVAIPITNDIITDENLTGTTGTIVGLIPMFLALAGLVGVAKMVQN